MLEHFLAENDILMNEKLSKVIRWGYIVFPIMALSGMLGFTEFSLGKFFVSSILSFIIMFSPYYLYKKNADNSFLKYYIITAVLLSVCIVGINLKIDLYVLLVLGVVLSIIYIDSSLSVYSCVLAYVMMLITMGFSVYDSYREVSNMKLMQHIMFNALGCTIEFAMIYPIIIGILKIIKSHMMKEQSLLKKLKDEQERYQLAMDSSRDILFEYDVAKDVLTYYGILLKRDKSEGKNFNDKTEIKGLLSRMQTGHILHPDDMKQVSQMLDNDYTDEIQIRYVGGEEAEWLELEGRTIFENNIPVKLVGKARNITGKKLEEQDFLQNSERDSITNFYDRRIGTRIIKQHATEAGRTDSQSLVYVSLLNGNILKDKAGEIFLNAVIIRMAKIMSMELSDMDLPVRFSECEFVLYLANRTPVMLEQLRTRVEEQFDKIYIGEEFVDRLEIRFESYGSLEDLEKAVSDITVKDRMTGTASNRINNGYIDYAFNILDNPVDFDVSIKLLLDGIGNLYSFDCIRVFAGLDSSGRCQCIYEWLNSEEDHGSDDIMLEKVCDINEFRKRSDYLICECAGLGEKMGYVVYKDYGFSLQSGTRRIDELCDIAHIMSNYIQKERSETANKAKSDFLSSMSHEIRTPMNAISGFAELILQDELFENDSNSTVLRYAENIRTSSNNLLGIINDILDFSKIEAGRFEIVNDRYYLHEIVEEVRNIISIQLSKTSVELVTKFDNSLPDGLIGDGVRIRQVLINMLNNSVKFTKSGQVGFEINWSYIGDDSGVFTGVVWDTGIGIKEEEIEKIFSAYEQADVKKNHGIRGTGLGLAITKQLIELMDGEIRVESVYGKGTKMIFTIPQKVFDPTNYDYDEALKGVKNIRVNRAAFTAPWARVLIVDDNRVNMEVAKGLLGRYKVKTVESYSGMEAIEILENDQDFDIVFMDHMMPDMDGIETARRVRRMGNPVLEKIPIIALTANVIKGMEQVFIDAGMNGFLSKPIDLVQLGSIMDEYIPIEKREG